MFVLHISFPRPDHLGEELFEAERDIAIPIIVVPLEYIRHPLQADASLYEEIETHSLSTSASAPPSLIQSCALASICSV